MRRDKPTDSERGFVLPEQAQTVSDRGTVVAVGPGLILRDGARGPMAVQAGDRVVFYRGAGTAFEFEESELLFLREDELLAVIEENGNGTGDGQARR